jgi:hypothetical protein
MVAILRRVRFRYVVKFRRINDIRGPNFLILKRERVAKASRAIFIGHTDFNFFPLIIFGNKPQVSRAGYALVEEFSECIATNLRFKQRKPRLYVAVKAVRREVNARAVRNLL